MAWPTFFQNSRTQNTREASDLLKATQLENGPQGLIFIAPACPSKMLPCPGVEQRFLRLVRGPVLSLLTEAP